MKTLSLVLALILTLTATGATAKSKELCEVVSEVTYQIAIMRDKGKTQEESETFLTLLGMKPNQSRAFLDLVYGAGMYFSPEDLKSLFFNFCIPEET